jgi:hypothetical protein
VKHETANENVEKFPTSQNMSHPEFGVTWDIEVKHKTVNEISKLIPSSPLPVRTSAFY